MKTRRPDLLICVLLLASLNSTVVRAADAEGRRERLGEAQRAEFDRTVARLQELGLLITADPQKIDQVTSEAAYFMYAQRKNHQPSTEPWKVPEKRHWLDGKPVLAARADKAEVYPLFSRLVEQADYDTVWIYTAAVHYGIDNWARFSLYKLGYRDADQRKCRYPPVLLGDGDYVLGLP
jgi:hypothetical protein